MLVLLYFWHLMCDSFNLKSCSSTILHCRWLMYFCDKVVISEQIGCLLSFVVCLYTKWFSIVFVTWNKILIEIYKHCNASEGRLISLNFFIWCFMSSISLSIQYRSIANWTNCTWPLYEVLCREKVKFYVVKKFEVFCLTQINFTLIMN